MAPMITTPSSYGAVGVCTNYYLTILCFHLLVLILNIKSGQFTI